MSIDPTSFVPPDADVARLSSVEPAARAESSFASWFDEQLRDMYLKAARVGRASTISIRVRSWKIT